MTPCNTYPASSVVPILFTTYAGSTGASATLTGLAVTDIEIYKGTSMTQRSSDAGYALLDTDGIDIDGITGLHGFSIDLGDNTDAGFFAVGSFYTVVVSAVTVDSQTVNFIADRFRIAPAEAITGHAKVDVGGWLGTAPATPTIAGVPEVDVTHVAGSTSDVSTIPASVAAILVDTGTTLDGKIDAIDNFIDTEIAAIQTTLGTPAGASLAADVAAVKVDTAAILVDTGTTLDAKIDAIDDLLDTEIAAIKSDTAAILTDTAEIGAAGAGLTNINLPNQTMDIVGNITGNLSGSVGSVTGAVGSVTGNVGGNVTGSVGSLTGHTVQTGDNYARTTKAIVTGTVGAASSTTSIVTSALAPAAAVADQFKGRIVVFDAATTTANLRGQATDITASTSGGVLTVTALTTAPASGDTFTIL